MAFTQRGWTLPGPALRDGARLVLRSDLGRQEEGAVAPLDVAETQLKLAFLGSGSRDRDGSARRLATEILAECGHARWDLARADTHTLLQQLEGLVARGLVVWVDGPSPRVPVDRRLDGGATALVNRPEARPAATARRPRRVVSVRWDAHQAWCSEAVTVVGTTENYPDQEAIEVGLRPQQGAQHQSIAATVDGNQFAAQWTVKDVLPARAGSRFSPSAKIDAVAGGHTTPRPLTVNFVTALDTFSYRSGSAHFDLSLVDDVVHVHGDIQYLPGWGGQVVKLGHAVTSDTGGLLDGQLPWPGYRWLKKTSIPTLRFWNGSTWQRLPEGFALTDKNHFAVGFYQDGDRYACQYGGHWPYGFSDWDFGAPEHQTRLVRWRDKIQRTWSGHFDLKREDCLSRHRKCCCYRTRVTVSFSRQTRFARGMVILAAEKLRSNDSVWFLGPSQDAVAAHEFGHRLGNPDEYGHRVDTSLNSDGAHQGIDPYSIMGQNLTWVKARHLRQICAAFSAAVADAFGKTYKYRAVPP